MMLEEVESAGQTQVSIAQVQPHNLSQCVSLGVCEWILCGRGLSVPDFAIGIKTFEMCYSLRFHFSKSALVL